MKRAVFIKGLFICSFVPHPPSPCVCATPLHAFTPLCHTHTYLACSVHVLHHAHPLLHELLPCPAHFPFPPPQIIVSIPCTYSSPAMQWVFPTLLFPSHGCTHYTVSFKKLKVSTAAATTGGRRIGRDDPICSALVCQCYDM